MQLNSGGSWQHNMSSDHLQKDRTLALLLRDAVGTLGDEVRAEVLATVENVAQSAREQMQATDAWGDREAEEGRSLREAQQFFEREAVDRFQQAVHDLHLDTTWPACPRHPNHPLWYRAESASWCCPRDGTPLAPLGGLASLRAPASERMVDADGRSPEARFRSAITKPGRS